MTNKNFFCFCWFSQRGDELTVPQEEAIAEKIDEEVHSLMYKLDHVCRLLQGSESEHFTSPPATNQKRRQTSNWETEKRKLGMKKKLSKVKLTAEHLLEHIDETQIDRGVLEEMYAHMATLDRQLTKFHDIVERNASKWQRNCSLPQTHIGDRLPVNLILPVTIDWGPGNSIPETGGIFAKPQMPSSLVCPWRSAPKLASFWPWPTALRCPFLAWFTPCAW